MLLALDAGNTNVTIGVFEKDELVRRWRLRTVREQTADEWGVLLRNLFSLGELDMRGVNGVIISSVVPSLDASLAEMTQRYFGCRAQFVTYRSNTGITILYDQPREVGADRIVNSVAAWHRFHAPCITIDLGTAITFDAVSGNAEYLGGLICPGIGIAIGGLFAKAAQLPMVDFREPGQVIGRNTVESMQAGLYYGFIGLIDGIVARLMEQLGPSTCTIATGGQAALIAKSSKLVQEVDEDLTLTGLQLIWRHNGRA